MDLLYRGSQDGWKTLHFHVKCDNKCANIAVIWSTGGFIFGGFADKSWKSFEDLCKSEKYFLFSLNIPSNGLGSTNIRIKKNMSCAMYHLYSYGPTFGGGLLRQATGEIMSG